MVQGVGFRPFVYRLATKYNITGWVENTNESVKISVTGNPADIDYFLYALREEAPPASMIENVTVTETEAGTHQDFTIHHSHNISDEITEISPDIAVCGECLEDIEREGSRLNYSFVNCTNCGPRFTIILDLPYDRAETTMHPFKMCHECRQEYESVTDRRFHAQPTACVQCGPHYELIAGGEKVSESIDVILARVAQIIANEGIVLIKGLGGMHLACDAFCESAVTKLRELKKRDGKPFAVMFRDIEMLKQYAEIDSAEEQSLMSWRRPIVLVVKKDIDLLAKKDSGISPSHDSDQTSLPPLAKNISRDLNLLGVMLPYLPFHYQLFQQLKTDAIVLTSGNFSSEPILTDNREANLLFSPCVDALVLHNRDIFNRTDDSVVRIMGGKERIFRRSRGYVPSPVRTLLNTDGIIAFGAELTNCFCIGKGTKAFLSQHIGDLQGLETTMFYEQTISKFLQLFRVTPSLLVTDMHPEYISTKAAQQFTGLPVVSTQHHHAHIASCMAEHNLDEMVIGVAFDGTGYGDDGNTWGSEFLLCDLNGYERKTHFEYVPMPGGDLATEEPWRMAVSWLYKVYGNEFLVPGLSLFNEIEPEKIAVLIRMIDRKINCPLTSGAGRLFDAVSSLLGLCQVATFQSEGPMRLESLVQKECNESYGFHMGETIGFDAMIRGIIDDLSQGSDIKIIASKFHNTLISVIFEAVSALRRTEGINKVVLSGGVFQNRYLLEGTKTLLEQHGFDLYTHASVPSGDGGSALGQLAIASKRRSLKCV